MSAGQMSQSNNLRPGIVASLRLLAAACMIVRHSALHARRAEPTQTPATRRHGAHQGARCGALAPN